MNHSIHCQGYRGAGREFNNDDCDCGATICNLKAEVERLRQAVDLMGPPRCENLHHAKKDLHGDTRPCPVEARINELIAADATGA